MINFNDLKKEISYKFKPQSIRGNKATMVAYIDARDVQDLLDEVVGPENWQTDYLVINDNLFCKIGIKIDNDWVWKMDCGTESMAEKEKGEASDAFKRAAVQWGVGRFLYRLGIVDLPTKEYNGKLKPATYDGKILWTNDEISEYIRSGKNTKKNETKNTKSNKYSTPEKEPSYSKVEYSKETVKRVTELKRGDLVGKDCLKNYINDYNKKYKTEHKQIIDFKSDEDLNKLMDFIESLPPDNI